MSILFEAPVFNDKSVLKAAEAGADRLDLCSSSAEGGETPGTGMLSWVKHKVNIPVFVMIRPRGGNFVYSSDDLEVMNQEIHASCKKMNRADDVPVFDTAIYIYNEFRKKLNRQ